MLHLTDLQKARWYFLALHDLTWKNSFFFFLVTTCGTNIWSHAYITICYNETKISSPQLVLFLLFFFIFIFYFIETNTHRRKEKWYNQLKLHSKKKIPKFIGLGTWVKIIKLQIFNELPQNP